MKRSARLAQPKTKVPAQPVTTIRVDPLVWATALAAADGDASRIKILSPTAVEVTN